VKQNTSKSIKAIMLVVALVASLLTAIATPTAANAQALTLTSVTPSTGSTLGGDTISLTGTGFLTSSFSVYVGGSLCQNLQVSDSSNLTCVTPPHAAGTVMVRVQIFMGPISDLANAFTFSESQSPAPTPVWTERNSAGTSYWGAIASSADGTKLAAASTFDENFNLGNIFTSTDSGATWTKRTSAGSRAWASISSSADGNKLAAVGLDGYIYTSIDAGTNWTARTVAGNRSWYDITSSADGTKLAATAFGGYIYSSTDSGLTWNEQTDAGIRLWFSITSSADGTKLAAADYGGYIYTSTDSGLTWTEETNPTSKYWTSIASSADGTKLAAAGSGFIYTSTDSGATWTEQTASGSHSCYGIASSADGTKLAAADYGGYIYTSNDSGLTWTEQTDAGTRDWYDITSSADGLKLAVAIAGGSIWTFGVADSQTPAPAPTIDSVSPAAGKLSGGDTVTIAGTNFVDGVTVTVGGTACGSVTFVSATSLTCVTPYLSPPVGSVGAKDVVVTNPDNQYVTATGAFTYVAPPTFVSVSPNTGPTAGGTTITITGTDFVTGDTVTLYGGVGKLGDCTNVQVVDSTTITCNTPAGTAGVSDINIDDIYKQNALGTEAFTFVAPPTFISLSPTSGPPAGGTRITITGTGFAAGDTVVFLGPTGGDYCTNLQVVDSSTITCDTPASTSGQKAVLIFDIYNKAAAGNKIFTYTAPVFTASTPSIPNTYVGSFSAVQTETVTNTGNGNLVFGAAAVTKTGANPADYTIVADNCSNQTVAPAATCTVTYKFKSAVAGTRTANLVFASNAASSPNTVALSAVAMGVVTIRKIDESSGSTRGGTTVEITGTGFNAAATVTIGGVTATVTKRKGSTSITVRTPARATTGKVLVVVTNPDTGNASYNGFTYKR